MAKTFSLSILSPDRVILEVDNVTRVTARLQNDTMLSIYPGHAPLLAEIQSGTLVYAVGDKQSELTLNSGILHIIQHHISVYANTSPDEDVGMDAADMREDGVIFEELSRVLMQSLKGEPIADPSQ